MRRQPWERGDKRSGSDRRDGHERGRDARPSVGKTAEFAVDLRVNRPVDSPQK